MSIHAMITEDDPLSRAMLCDMLESYFPDVKVVKTAGTVEDSCEYLKENTIDLLFLDLDLPDGKGTEILATRQADMMKVIITTSFKVIRNELPACNLVGLLFKPLTQSDLRHVMNKVITTNR